MQMVTQVAYEYSKSMDYGLKGRKQQNSAHPDTDKVNF